jgi:hypothetical protein
VEKADGNVGLFLLGRRLRTRPGLVRAAHDRSTGTMKESRTALGVAWMRAVHRPGHSPWPKRPLRDIGRGIHK